MTKMLELMRPNYFTYVRPMTSPGVMESMTTIRHDYIAKYGERPEAILPCSSIRTSSAPLESKTMTKMSYMAPGPTEPTISYKPIRRYQPPSQPLPDETTQKLSFQPFALDKKETYPWAKKPTYTYV